MCAHSHVFACIAMFSTDIDVLCRITYFEYQLSKELGVEFTDINVPADRAICEAMELVAGVLRGPAMRTSLETTTDAVPSEPTGK